MKEKFWKFMDSAKGFCVLIGTTIIAGILWTYGSKRVIDKVMKEEK
jgi:hypothetical protein